MPLNRAKRSKRCIRRRNSDKLKTQRDRTRRMLLEHLEDRQMLSVDIVNVDGDVDALSASVGDDYIASYENLGFNFGDSPTPHLTTLAADDERHKPNPYVVMPLYEERKLLPSDGMAGDLFGLAVDTAGKYAVVGAPEHDAGAAYVFDTSTREQLHRLVPDDAVDEDYFGFSVSIHGHLAVIGATEAHAGGTSDAGAAYVFDLSTGDLVSKLVASDPGVEDDFGATVGISGNIAIVGAIWADAAYLFDVATGTELSKITASDGSSGDQFGKVAIHGDLAVVGANLADPLGADSGAAYLYDISDPTAPVEVAKLLPSDGAAGDGFGGKIAIEGNLVAVGAYADDDRGTDAGAVYLFDVSNPNEPVEVSKLTASDGTASDNFGGQMSISGDLLAVGASGVNDQEDNAGAAYVFNVSNPQSPVELMKLTASDGAAGDWLGSGIAIDAHTVLAGAYTRDEAGVDSGAAYLFSFAYFEDMSPVIDVGKHVLLPNTPGQVIPIHVAGGTSVQGVVSNFQIADGFRDVPGSTINGPDITSVDLVAPGTVFGEVANNGNNSIESREQIWIVGTSTSEGVVPAEGVLAYVTVDTTGWFGGDGSWEFKLGETFNGDTNFQSPDGQVVPTIINGSIRIDCLPVAAPGGPYTVAEGGSITLDGSGSFDPDPGDTIVLYEWDFDGDGKPDEYGSTPTFSAVGLDGPSTVTAFLQVTDNHGGKGDPVAVEIEIVNVTPVLEAVEVTPTAIYEDGIAALSGTIVDPGIPDTFTLRVNWGDGSPTETIQYPAGTTSFSEMHQYLDDDPSGTESDDYSITVTVFDDDMSPDPSEPLLQEDFDDDPQSHGWVSTDLANVRWGESGFYRARVNDETGAPRWGYSPVFDQVDGQSFTLDFDMRPTSTSWGTYPQIVLHQDGDDNPYIDGSVAIEAHWSDDGRDKFYLVVNGIGTPHQRLDRSPQFDTALWYHHTVEYDADSDVLSWEITERDTGEEFYSASYNDIQVWPFNQTAIGYQGVPPIYGSWAEIYVDKIELLGGPQPVSVMLTVENEAPALAPVADQTIRQVDSLDLRAAFSDLGTLDAHTATVDWGDGSLPEQASVTEPNAGNPGEVHSSHMYQRGGIYTVTVTVQDDDTGSHDLTFAVYVQAEVVDRLAFYNNSAFDGNDPAVGTTDDNAVALDKVALLVGETATFANYTSYGRGINGIMVDVAGLWDTPTAADFVFTIGNDNDPSGWSTAPAPESITVRPGEGVDGSDRITLIWSDDDPYTPEKEPGSISNQWLQVTVLATANTGLAEDDVFYFGNAIGECGNSAVETNVDTNDEIGARNHPHSLFDPAPVDDVYDYDRDSRVDTNDEIIARNNSTSAFTRLQLITVPHRTAGADLNDGGASNTNVLPVVTTTTGDKAGPWHNAALASDVNGDGNVSQIDVLSIVDWLNTQGSGALRTVPADSPEKLPFVDTNDDGALSPLDALLVISELNRSAGEAEIGATTMVHIVDAVQGNRFVESHGADQLPDSAGTPSQTAQAPMQHSLDGADRTTRPHRNISTQNEDSHWIQEDLEDALCDIALDISSAWAT